MKSLLKLFSILIVIADSLGINAVVIITLWQTILARVNSLKPSPIHYLILGLSISLAYLGDRWVDCFNLQRNTLKTPRHRFIQKHLYLFLLLFLILLTLNLLLSLFFLTKKTLLIGVIFLSYVILYTFSISRHNRYRYKEFHSSLILTVSTFIFLIEQNITINLFFLILITAFYLLCLTNLSLISESESSLDENQGFISISHKFTHIDFFVKINALLVILLGGLIIIITNFISLGISILATGLGFYFISLLSQHIPSLLIRYFADIILLFPAIYLLF